MSNEVEPTLPRRVVVLISGSGSNLQALMDACRRGDIAGEVVAVISNKANAYGLQRAQAAGIPSEILEHSYFPDRQSFDTALMQHIERYQPDLVVLAGFMRILTPEFVRYYQGRLLNIHPSLLPLYKGVRTHERALEDGVKEHGASVHFVTPELDGGPVIMQARVPVLPSDNPESLAQRVLSQEHIIYPRVVKWFTDGRLRLENNQVYLDNRPLYQPAIHLGY